MLSLYQNIKARRKALGMTQAQLAEALGYSDKSAISHIEGGTVNLPLSKIHQFADVLHTTPSALMGDDGIADNPVEPTALDYSLGDGLLTEIIEIGKQMDSYHLGKYLEWGKKILESQKMIGE